MPYYYLSPRDGAVVDGLESEEVVYAKTQSRYLPLRCLVSSDDDGRVISRWALTDRERELIAAGGDIFLELLTFHQKLQPIRIAVGQGEIDPDWVRVCLLSRPEAIAKNRAELEAL